MRAIVYVAIMSIIGIVVGVVVARIDSQRL